MNTDCCWYRYENDTGFCYCQNDSPEYEDDEELEEVRENRDDPCIGCKSYYTKDDAWADAHYGFRDHY